MTIAPWTNGPREILIHGLDLLNKDSDTNRRLAIICIDNSVELMIKTFLGLPKRINNLKITRKEYDEFSESFPKLLDALEKFAPDKLIGVDLGEIEWFHRLRNQLYHAGNGLTVEKSNVEVYSELANILFKNIFGLELIHTNDKKELLADFLAEWVLLEKGIHELAQTHSLLGSWRNSVLEALKFLKTASLISTKDFNELNQYRNLRNEIVHGKEDYREVLSTQIINRLKFFVTIYGVEK